MKWWSSYVVRSLGLGGALFLALTACKTKNHIEPNAAQIVANPNAPSIAEPDVSSAEETDVSPVAEPDVSPVAEPDISLAEETDTLPASKPNGKSELRAAARYERIVGRVRPQNSRRFANLLLEANNAAMRGARRESSGPYQWTGLEIAQKWREAVDGVPGVFVLRDSLFSQQDHPYLQQGYAPMLPPNWVTVAVEHAMKGEALRVPELPDPDDHDAWSRLSVAEVFGSFPVSQSLYGRSVLSTRKLKNKWSRDFARNSRETLRSLMEQARQMREGASQGPERVAQVGAALIAKSDARYFGAGLRRCCVIPILVENPNPKEVAEGKGVHAASVRASEEVLNLVMTHIYRRRLRDGDLAIERYDLSSKGDRSRAIKVLEALIPKGEKAYTSKVWLWVNGRLDPKKKLQGEGPLPYVPAFRVELAAANIELSRLRLLAKPTVVVRGSAKERRAIITQQLPQYERLDVMMSVSSPAPALIPILSD